MLDFRPAVADTCVEQGLFHWLLKRVGQKGPFDGNKMYSSELLALLLQCSEEARKALTDKVDGIDILLRVSRSDSISLLHLIYVGIGRPYGKSVQFSMCCIDVYTESTKVS